MVGLEPTPNRLKADCSAIELHPRSFELLDLDLMQEPYSWLLQIPVFFILRVRDSVSEAQALGSAYSPTGMKTA